MTTFDSHLQRFGDRLVLVIERYDREIHGNKVDRIHQEDAAQALSLRWNSDAKFEAVDTRANLHAVAGLVSRTRQAISSAPGDLERLLAFVTFNAAIGNTDAHAKNFSIVHYSNGRVALAPLYDVSTHAMATGGQQNMALRINGLASQPDLRLTDLVAEGVSWGLKPEAAEALVHCTLTELRDAVCAGEQERVDSSIPAYIDRQSANLLGGQRAGAGIGQPPALHHFTHS
ncbi:HipA domain-containing protein [Arthrobacter livingstonensis]|uniref:HipA domain-containing protein n=1 Tax=Arthrobacter livingstonensis TaxID=670078 RepID=UPI001FEC1702|nr:HipA domain-containing protein [Arthrobacter livingstonensis]